jgi:hypothetical protein
MNRLFNRILMIAMLAMASGAHGQQQAVSDSSFIAPKPKKTKVETIPVEKQSPVEVTGVIKQAVDTKKVYELVNPMAPQKYGDGQDDISWDPDNQDKPKGIILFGLQW